MSLDDILACPNCRVRVERQAEALHCSACGQNYPIVRGVPVMFPDASVPHIQHEDELVVRHEYLPWVNRIILQSLLDNQVALDIGSGSMTLDDPCLIRMDVTWSPYVDLVADAHALPFLPGSLDYIFSLAVAEQSKLAASKSRRVTFEQNMVIARHVLKHEGPFVLILRTLEYVWRQLTGR